MYNIFITMHTYPTGKKTLTQVRYFFALLCIFIFTASVYAVSPNSAPGISWEEEKNLSVLQQQARLYRGQGIEYQRTGNLDAAMTLYQKAVDLDPRYAVAFNDLGVVYEAQGKSDRAERSYLQAIRIDPNYLSAYTNLAIVAENNRDLEKAAMFWKKRAELGSSDDPWTQKAKQRLEDIALVSTDDPFEDAREQEIMSLVQDVTAFKASLKKDDKALSRHYFEKAQAKYKEGDEVTAYKIALDAQQFDPTNHEIEEFVTNIQTRLLSK